MSTHPSRVLCGPGMGMRGLRGKTKWNVGGKRGWLGVCTDFHFSPSAYVRMLSLSPFQVLPLQMLELSVCNGFWGGGGGFGRAGGRKSGKISILNKHNFVTWQVWHPLFNVSQLPVSTLLLSCVPLFSRFSSTLSRTLQGSISALNSPASLMNCIPQPFEFCRCLIVSLVFYFFFSFFCLTISW